MEPSATSILKHQQLYWLLPKRLQEKVTTEVESAKAGYGLKDLNKTRNIYPIFVASGIAIFLAGLALTLAAYRVLPSSVNSISQLGRGGFILGYGGMAVGTLGTILASVKTHRVPIRNQLINSVYKSQYFLESTEIAAYFPNFLHDNEILAIDDEVEHQIHFYSYGAASEGVTKHTVHESLHYPDTAEKILVSLRSTGSSVLKGKTFIDFNTLADRRNQFEQSVAK